MMTDDDTQHISRASLMGRLGLSVRGVVVSLMIATVCACALLKFEVNEPLYSLSIAAISYYFGQQQRLAIKP